MARNFVNLKTFQKKILIDWNMNTK